MQNVHATQNAFQRLKGICVPLLANSLITPSSISAINELLSKLHDALAQFRAEGHVLAPAAISYVFFPISSILRRNDISTIPDQTLEQLLSILALLSDVWWWNMEVSSWEQIFMLCSAILGGIDRKGKGKEREEETKLSAARVLWALLRDRSSSEDPALQFHPDRAHSNFIAFISHAQTTKFLSVMGQTINSLLTTSESQYLPLQRMSMKVLFIIFKEYLPDGFVTSIFPGTVSSMAKVALGTGTSRGWANGDIVAAALQVMEQAIVRTVGNDICIREGAVREIDHLEDLIPQSADIDADAPPTSPFTTLRTATWLRATSSQLHIALNSLSPLVKHQTPAALSGLATFSATVLSTTTLTLPQSQALLLSFLLSICNSAFSRVSHQADVAMRRLLITPSNSRHHILKVLLQISSDNLAALPRLLLSHSDAKVEHLATILYSVCRLATTSDDSQLPSVPAISTGVGRLLGPHGGVEKWGWGFLSTLEIDEPPLVVAQHNAHLTLEGTTAILTPFPELALLHVSVRSAQEALANMFRALGETAQEDCLFAVEWFVDVGLGSRGRRAVTALWCACRLLEGAGGIELGSRAATSRSSHGKRLENFARKLARRIAESWDDWEDEEMSDQEPEPQVDPGEENILIEHVQGLVTVRSVPDAEGSVSLARKTLTFQPLLHCALSLQLLAITAGILEARFLPLLLHVLYPVLHAVVSDTSFISMSGLAALDHITNSTSYATPANLLLSNFDYALDSVSRHLTRRRLDIEATKVFAVLVRLVGHGVVQKAGDVVEECFDRLDEYHGYELIVDGLVDVLNEVVKAVAEDEDNRLSREARAASLLRSSRNEDGRRIDNFVAWFTDQNDRINQSSDASSESTFRDNSYPREAWVSKEDTPEDNAPSGSQDPFAKLTTTPAQTLTTQIVSRSVYFLTHQAPTVRARILLLLAHAVPVLPESALLPAVHSAWPFVLNRLADTETFVVSAAAALIAALSEHVGDFMTRRVWDDVWPRFRTKLQRLAEGDRTSALASKNSGMSEGVGTASAYTHSHRLYKAIIDTMTAAARGVQAQDLVAWEVIVLFRRFLRRQAHEELQACTRGLYIALADNNADAVWLALAATLGRVEGPMAFLWEPKWDIELNVKMIMFE